jgi:hypothetical protein
VTDPAVLSRFPLDRTVAQIITTGIGTLTGTELLQRLFDTENATAGAVFADAPHCDSANNAAFEKGKAVDCPRAEGKLATSTGFFVDGNPDHFVPVAIVNRFDLMPSNFLTCGEYRIVYAKVSGRTDPNDRVLIIFEGALGNPQHNIAGCRPVAEFLSSLENPNAADGAPAGLADKLEAFFFTGLSGFDPVVQASNYGLDSGNCSYAGGCGQVRVGQGMQSPWEFRQFQIRAPAFVGSQPLFLTPTPVTSTPRPELFELQPSYQNSTAFKETFMASVGDLQNADLTRLHMLSSSEYDAGESALDGLARPDYAARVAASAFTSSFVQEVSDHIAQIPYSGCPADDPLTPESLFDRATALTCAGCHAPDKLLPPGRRVGCGQAWPATLGQTHIDEQGRLSPALVDLFLPHRADVLATYLQACDQGAIDRNLQPSPAVGIPECLVAGTAVTMADGTEKTVERIEPGDMVLSFDEAERRVVAARVERRFVRADTDRLIVVNGSLVATPNHAFRTARGWVPAESLAPGDALVELADADPTDAVAWAGERSSVRALETRPGSVVTYNLAVAVHHAFFAGGVLVHDGP